MDKAEHGDMLRVSSMLKKHPYSYRLMGMSQYLKTVGPKPSQQIEIMTLSNCKGEPSVRTESRIRKMGESPQTIQKTHRATEVLF